MTYKADTVTMQVIRYGLEALGAGAAAADPDAEDDNPALDAWRGAR